MSRTPRGVSAAVVAIIVAVSALAGIPAASGTPPPPPGPGRSMPTFTHAHARALLARAKRQLKTDALRVKAHRPVGNGPSTDITMTLRDLYLARPSLSGEQRRQADAILARPTTPGGDDVGSGTPINYGANTVSHYCGAVACVHWVSAGPERLVKTTDANTNGVPDYVETVYATVAHVLDYEHNTLGYRLPLSDGGTSATPDNPNGNIDIYLANLGPRGLYGYCAPDDGASGRKVPGYCVLDNDYSPSEFGSPNYLNPLRVTAAHELFHSIQFGYDVGEDLWFMEGTATWVEDEVYDAINDNLQYLAFSPIRYPTSPADVATDYHRYGSWIFFKYASERLGPSIVRRMWELADASSSRYSLQAIRAAVSARTSWTPFFALFAAWNTRQPHGYSEAASYPAPTWSGTRVLTKKHKSTGWLTIDLPHLSSAPLRLIPGAKLKPGKRLRIDANLPPTGRGTALLVQRRFRNGTVSDSMMALNAQGDGHLRIGFNRKVLAYVALIPTNTSTTMVACGFYPDTYSCNGRGYYDSGQRYQIRAKVG